MKKTHYNWKRYWCLRDGGFHIDANGFLLRGEYLNKDTIEFESIAETPCLVLLGEPGIGKSRALQDAVEFVSQSFPNDKCYSLDLRSFGSETRLFDALFKGRAIEDWLNGSHRLHLFLDSFDECLLRVDTVAALLADELKTGKYPIERLLFRITSRTAEFPRGLEKDLREIWKSGDGETERIKIYELCPLQASDVWAAAQIEGIAPESFFKEMTAKNAGTLAARPVTLRFLLNLYRKNNSFPDKLTDLYEQGCRVLCDEQNDERRASPVLKGKLTADQRLQIAGRIAAVMVFCNKIAVWKDAETGESEDTDILIREIAGEFEKSANIDFPVTEKAVRETLVQTGLFTARGASRLGWSHQTFAEFLAAWYVARQNIGTHQILSLVTYPSDAQKQITPQLQEAAAWLASLRPDIFDELLKTDPLLLLKSDVASFSADLRTKLVDELLKIFAAEQASDWGWHSYYPRLKHPDLAAQLLPVIKDKNAHYLARRFAIDVAEACELRELQNDLAEVILDETEADYVRSNAGYALWHVGDAQTKKRIKHYAINGSPNDKDERVRGIALLCNWNENLTAEEVFASLVHSPHLHDSYGLFLSSHFLSKLKIADLPVALRWVKENAEQFGHDFSIERVIDEIMLLGWQNLDAPEVLQTFAEAALVRLRLFNHHVIKISNIYEGEQISGSLADNGKRRKVLRAIAPLLNKKTHDFFRVFRSPLLRPTKEDLPFLINRLADSNSAGEQENLAEIITEFYRFAPIEPEVFGFLYEGYTRSENVRNFFSHIIELVELNSEIALKMKSDYANALKQQKEFAEMEAEHRPPLLDPPPKERVLKILERIEKGEKLFFWLTQELSLESDSQFYSSDWEADATKLPGWAEADLQTRDRIIEAAKNHILHGDPENKEWVGTNSFQYSALGGFRALVLLLETAREFIQELNDEVWEKWAAIIALHPSFGRDEKSETHSFLNREVYKHAPDEIIATILKVIDAANEKEDHLFFERNWEAYWDEKFKTALREKLNDAKLKFSIWGRILEKLLEHGDAPTQEIAQNILTAFVAGEAEKELALLATASLMRHARGADWWNFVWQAIEKDADFGRAFVESICFQTRPVNKLNERESAAFYLWMTEVFPPSEDPEIPMGHTYAVGTRMEITTFRDSVLGDLKQRGTPESLAALERIATASPELSKRLHWTLIEARENLRRHTWQPPTPAELLALLKQKNAATVLPPPAEIMKKTLTDEEIGCLIWNGKTVADIPALFNFLRIYRDRPNDVVFFVGAGLSTPLFPGWNAALDKLLVHTSKRFSYPKEREENLKRMLSEGKLLDVADACARDLGENSYRSFIENNFDREFLPEEIPNAYSALLDLRPQTILTTNYDRIPEVGGRGGYRIYTNTNIGEALSAIQNNKTMVFKLHGNVTQQNSIVFTRAEYQNVYRNLGFRDFITAIFNLKTVIFLGFGLTDPYFNFVLENIFAVNDRILQGKYALLEGLSPDEIQAKERGYGLNVIPYRKSTDSHPEVLKLIELLKVKGEEKHRDNYLVATTEEISTPTIVLPEKIQIQEKDTVQLPNKLGINDIYKQAKSYGKEDIRKAASILGHQFTDVLDDSLKTLANEIEAKYRLERNPPHRGVAQIEGREAIRYLSNNLQDLRVVEFSLKAKQPASAEVHFTYQVEIPILSSMDEEIAIIKSSDMQPTILSVRVSDVLPSITENAERSISEGVNKVVTEISEELKEKITKSLKDQGYFD
jgi:hypothetical protein